MLVGITVIFAFLGALLLTLALFGQERNPVPARIRALAGQSEDLDVGRRRGSSSFIKRVALPLLEGMGNTIATQLPAGIAGHIRELLTVAGRPVTLTAFLSLTALSAVGIAGLFLALMLWAGASLSGGVLIALLVFFLLGLFLPYFWLSRKASKRQHAIVKNLPNALDLITTCVEAGLGLDAAFAKVAEKVPGPFADELAQALRDISMGRSHREALQDIGARTGVAEVISFLNSIIHAETTGANVGEVLRVQAEQIRMKQRQRIEQVAQKMPIWMTFPLVLFLLPSLFIVIIGPAVIGAFQKFGN